MQSEKINFKKLFKGMPLGSIEPNLVLIWGYLDTEVGTLLHYRLTLIFFNGHFGVP